MIHKAVCQSVQKSLHVSIVKFSLGTLDKIFNKALSKGVFSF